MPLLTEPASPSRRHLPVVAVAALSALLTPCVLTASQAGIGSAVAAPAARKPAVERSVVHWAPDRRIKGVVIHYQPHRYGRGESRVEIRDRAGRLLGLQDYSNCGTQGYQVERARWTPNSRFFVFSMRSGGGHQPWNHPTHFFGRRSRKFGSLDPLVDGIGIEDGRFHLQPRARVTVAVVGRARRTTLDLERLSRAQLREAWVDESQLLERLRKGRGYR